MAVFLVIPFWSTAQVKITGQILSDAGEELIGATIKIDGTTTGTITDIEGRFTLEVEEKDHLTISYLGFLTKKITVGTSTDFSIILEPDIEALEEVIVIGYGTQKKSDITGSVVSIRKADMNPGPVVSVSNLMQNTAPGVVLTQTSTQPGGGFDINIRGASSVLGGTGPLYVIDGLPISQNDNIQPGSSSTFRTSRNKNPLNGINPSRYRSY
ncbi:MAG: carboxypeptidase-like regulatory domain-containing protein [Bacteroidota bacterium]